MSRKQFSRGGLAAPQILAPAVPRPRPPLSIDLSRDARGRRELDAQFLRVVSHLKCRPEPRHAWDNRARRDQRVAHPAADAVSLCQGAYTTALDSGNLETIRNTRLEIFEYFDRCAAEAIRVQAPAHVLPIGATSANPHLALIKESSEAIVAVATAHAEQTETAFAHARREALEAVEQLCTYLGKHLPSIVHRQQVS